MGVVKPRHGLLRRALFPIYALDQLIAHILFALPIIWLSTVNSELAVYAGVGAYVGSMIAMQPSTPSTLLLPLAREADIIDFLDASPFLRRTGEANCWMSTASRFGRWDTDIIRVQAAPHGVVITGRLIDLDIMAYQLGG
jgi:hypothetical protein